MRVFYPISARISDLVNEQANVKSGWMPVCSILTIAVIAIVSQNLITFEGGAAERQHETFTQSHAKHDANNITTQRPQRSSLS